MMVYRGGQSPSSPKGSMWHTAQYINYGSRWHAHMPWVILFLWTLIPRKNCRRCTIYPTEVIQEGVKKLLLQKRCTQRKLAMSMGVSKTTVHHWIVGSTICVHCNSLKPVLTEENKVARLLMVLHFRDPVNLTNIVTCLIRSIWMRSGFSSPRRRRGISFSRRRKTPQCCIKHKSHIAKVMFLCAVAHPRLNLLQTLGGMESWGYGQLVTGNW